MKKKKKATSGPSQSDDNDENVEGKLKIERRKFVLLKWAHIE